MASYKLCSCGSCKKRKARNYIVRWRDKAGKQKSTHAKTSAEAKQILADVERDLTVGRDNKDITLNEYALTVPFTKGNKDTREIVDKVWAKHIKNSIGKYQINEIGRADINDWLDNTLMGYTPSTKRKYLGYVERTLDFAVVDKIIEVNPTKLIYIEGDKREREPQPLTPDQLFDFIDVWDNDPILKEYSNFVVALAFTGMRPSEASALRWENVDLVNKEIKVRENFRKRADGSLYHTDELKTPRARRTIAIPDYLVARLRFRRDTHPHEEFVFSSSLGYPISLNNFRRRYWRRALTMFDTNIDVPYDLRHTFSAIMHSTGSISVYELSEIMGHANPQTTINWYGSWWDKANHSAVATLNDWAEQGITKFKAN